MKFYQLHQRLDEELLRQISMANAVKRSGIPMNFFQNAASVSSINDFIQNPPFNVQDAYALGLTNIRNPRSNTSQSIYSHLTQNLGLKHWNKAFEEAFGPEWYKMIKNPDVTDRFLDYVIRQNKPIFFFIPNEALQKEGGRRYTSEEVQYFLRRPDLSRKLLHVVLGAYDLVDPDDYDTHVNKQPELMQQAIRDPNKYAKPGNPY